MESSKLNIIDASQQSSKKKKTNVVEDMAMEVSYQFKIPLGEVLDMSYPKLRKYFKFCRKKEAELYYNLTNIAAAPHSTDKNGKNTAVQELQKQYEAIING